MSTMLTLLGIVVPVFLVVAAGFASARTGFLAGSVIDALSSFAIRIAIPALLFMALLRIDLDRAVDWRALVAFFAALELVFLTGMTISRRFWHRRPGEAVAVGFSAFFGNAVMLGIPIADRAYGGEVTAAVFGLVAFHSAHNYFFGFVAMETGRRDGASIWGGLRRAAITTARNPLMWSFAGLALNIVGIGLPVVLAEGLDMLGSAGIPVALFSLGGVLTRYRLRDRIGEALMVSTLTLVLMPALAWFLSAVVFGLSSTFVHAIVILAAMPPGLNGYIFASLYDRSVGTAASAILLGTILSLGSITIWLALLAAFA